MSTQERFIRLPEVMAITGYKKSAIWHKVKTGTFPKQYKIGARASAWKLSEVNEWLDAQLVVGGLRWKSVKQQWRTPQGLNTRLFTRVLIQ